MPSGPCGPLVTSATKLASVVDSMPRWDSNHVDSTGVLGETKSPARCEPSVSIWHAWRDPPLLGRRLAGRRDGAPRHVDGGRRPPLSRPPPGPVLRARPRLPCPETASSRPPGALPRAGARWPSGGPAGPASATQRSSQKGTCCRGPNAGRRFTGAGLRAGEPVAQVTVAVGRRERRAGARGALADRSRGRRAWNLAAGVARDSPRTRRRRPRAPGPAASARGSRRGLPRARALDVRSRRRGPRTVPEGVHAVARRHLRSAAPIEPGCASVRRCAWTARCASRSRRRPSYLWHRAADAACRRRIATHSRDDARWCRQAAGSELSTAAASTSTSRRPGAPRGPAVSTGSFLPGISTCSGAEDDSPACHALAVDLLGDDLARGGRMPPRWPA